MRAPLNVAHIETPLATCWIEEGVLCVNPKNVDRDGEGVRRHYEILHPHLNSKRLCWLIDLGSVCKNFDIDARRMIEKELPLLCTALAIIADTPCAKMVANYFHTIRHYEVPVEVFANEKSAREWLSTICPVVERENRL
jgi:hypothetical protein